MSLKKADLGVYDGLSGYSHPTLWGIRDCQQLTETGDGGVVIDWVRNDDFIPRVCSSVASGTFRLLRQLFGFYGWDPEGFRAWADTLNTALPDVVVG